MNVSGKAYNGSPAIREVTGNVTLGAQQGYSCKSSLILPCYCAAFEATWEPDPRLPACRSIPAGRLFWVQFPPMHVDFTLTTEMGPCHSTGRQRAPAASDTA